MAHLNALMPQFKLTKLAFSANGVPEAVLLKLEPLKNKEFTTGDAFVAEIAKVLSPDELQRYGSELQNRADLAPRIVLHFTGTEEPELWKTEFQHRGLAPCGRRTVRGKDEGAHEADGSFQWSAAVKV